MSGNGILTKSIILCASIATLAGTLYYIRSRKKRVLHVSTSEKFNLPRNLSWSSFFSKSTRERSQSGVDTGHGENLGAYVGVTNSGNPPMYVSDSTDRISPENSNAGFNSNQTWLGTDRSSVSAQKTDLLHSGHINGGKLIVVMVGLPGRGKTYIARKIARYLRWISYRTRAFSLAKYRLDLHGAKTADFFDPSNEGTYNQRVMLLENALEDSMRYLNRGGEIAILDGTNTNKSKRKLIIDRVAKEDGYGILWIETIGNENYGEITDKIFNELKNSPDFIDKEDYLKRMAYYTNSYEKVCDDEGSYIKIYNECRTLSIHEIHGFLRSKIVSFVMNLQPYSKAIYIARHGESDFNVRGLVGGDSGLSQRGVEFSKALSEFLYSDELGEDQIEDLCIWTSTMRRARDTVGDIRCKRLVEWRSLREIEVGICDGLSYEQIKTKFPEEYRARNQDKLRYRYPRGESYLDVINRLEPVILELERITSPVLIIAHQAVLRCLYAYFLDLSPDEIPFLSVPLHTLIQLEAKAYGCKEKRMRIIINEELNATSFDS